MKKQLLVAIAGIALLSSCNKSYNCVCTSVKPDGTVVDRSSKNISGRTRNNAKDECAKQDFVNGDVTTTCLLD